MGRLLVGICALALVVPGAVSVRAQEPDGAQRRMGPPRVHEALNRFNIVLDHRADLALTPEQVTQLEAQRVSLGERNKPLEDEARNIISTTRGGEDSTDAVAREVAMANFERVRKVRDQIQKNDKDAWKDSAEKVLTKDQKKKADKMIAAKEDELKGPKPGFQGQRGGPMSGRHRPGGSPQ